MQPRPLIGERSRGVGGWGLRGLSPGKMPRRARDHWPRPERKLAGAFIDTDLPVQYRCPLRCLVSSDQR
jgi:hypothetical protein